MFNVLETFPGGGYWIGGNDFALEGVFVWDSGNALTFQNWDVGEPSNTYSNFNCMRSRSYWRWHDMNCGSKYQSICEKEPANTGK